jgi:hypothetical protein
MHSYDLYEIIIYAVNILFAFFFENLFYSE